MAKFSRKNASTKKKKGKQDRPSEDTDGPNTIDPIRSKVITKQEKRRNKHENFINALKNSSTVAKKVSKSPLEMKELQSLFASLPMEMIGQNKSKNHKVPKLLDDVPVKSVHRRQNTAISEISHFQKVLNHPAFQQNAVSAIQEHLRHLLPKKKPNTSS